MIFGICKKQIIAAYKNAGLSITKIRRGRIPNLEKGIFVYHPYGAVYSKTKINKDWIDTANNELFENSLKLAIFEATIRKNSNRSIL
jgi:hypothetical protein